MQREHSYLKSSVWDRNQIVDTNEIISRAFQYVSIVEYKTFVIDLVNYSFSNEVYSEKSPADVWECLRQIESIVNAAFVIIQEKVSVSIFESENEYFNPKSFCGKLKYVSIWDYMPKNLEEDEYCNPRIAFKRFFEFMEISEWKSFMNNILTYSMGIDTIYEEWESRMNIVKCRDYILKLLEAAHLINVREIEQDYAYNISIAVNS